MAYRLLYNASIIETEKEDMRVSEEHLSKEEAFKKIQELLKEHDYDKSTDDQDEP